MRFAEKFCTVSERILPLPTKVRMLSGVLIVETKRPISSTVPVTLPAVTKSPALNGRRIMRKMPAAKFASRPLHAAPIGETGAREQRREARRLDAEEAEQRDDEDDVQRDGERGAEEADHRRLDRLMLQTALHQADTEIDQATTDDPDRDRTDQFQAERDQPLRRRGVEAHDLVGGHVGSF